MDKSRKPIAPNPEPKPAKAIPPGDQTRQTRQGSPESVKENTQAGRATDVRHQEWGWDLEQDTDSRGVTRFREGRAINSDYNPEGITIASLLLTLRPHYTSDICRLLEFEKHLDESFVPKDAEEAETLEAHEYGYWAPPETTHMVRAEDRALADFIREVPVAIMIIKQCRQAVARWCYSAWYGRTPEVRIHGDEMLEIIRPKGRTPPERVMYTESSLAAAYEDLVEYSEGLRNCIQQTADEKQVRGIFPECDVLGQVGISIVGILAGEMKLPRATQIAKLVLGKITGVARSTLMEKIAKGMGREPTPKKQIRPVSPEMSDTR